MPEERWRNGKASRRRAPYVSGLWFARQRLQPERGSRRRSGGMRRVRQDATLADSGAQGQYASPLDVQTGRAIEALRWRPGDDTPIARDSSNALPPPQSRRRRRHRAAAGMPLARCILPLGTDISLRMVRRARKIFSEHSLRRDLGNVCGNAASIEDALSAVNDFLRFFSSARHHRVNIARFADLAPLS